MCSSLYSGLDPSSLVLQTVHVVLVAGLYIIIVVVLRRTVCIARSVRDPPYVDMSTKVKTGKFLWSMHTVQGIV